jgi:hypothetical protein
MNAFLPPSSPANSAHIARGRSEHASFRRDSVPQSLRPASGQSSKVRSELIVVVRALARAAADDLWRATEASASARSDDTG